MTTPTRITTHNKEYTCIDRLWIDAIDNEISIVLTDGEMEHIRTLANAKSQRYQQRKFDEKGLSPYKSNASHSHFVGMACEYGAWLILDEIIKVYGLNTFLSPVFKIENRESECDLILNDTRIEVKGMPRGAWFNYGACVTAHQKKRIQKKADVILWVTIIEQTNRVIIKGFSNVADIDKVEPTMTGNDSKKILNHVMTDFVKPITEMF